MYILLFICPGGFNMSVFSIALGNEITLSLLLEGGETDQYPRATFYNTSGTTSTYNLSPIAQGRYESTVPASEVTVIGTYRSIYKVFTDALYTIESSDYWLSIDTFLVSNSSITTLTEMLTRLLGISHENAYLDRATYDECNQLQDARLRCFDSKTNVDAATPGGVETTGLVAMYSISANYTNPGQLLSYKMTRDI